MRRKLCKEKFFRTLLTMMLIVAMASTVVGCGSKKRGSDAEQTGKETQSQEIVQADEASQASDAGQNDADDRSQETVQADEASQASDAGQNDADDRSQETVQADEASQASDAGQNDADDQSQETVLGEGAVVIRFVVIDKEGSETSFEIHTDKETVGDALLEHDLIAGEQSDYGLYVKQVIGITADYDVDKTYWAFYINGDYATAGVDATPIKEGETYTLKVEK